MLESFGAKVRSAVSGRTNLLITGVEPGASKVASARSRPNCQLISLADLAACIECRNGLTLETVEPPRIDGFSAGWRGNGLGRLAEGPTAKKLAIKRKRPQMEEDEDEDEEDEDEDYNDDV